MWAAPFRGGGLGMAERGKDEARFLRHSSSLLPGYTEMSSFVLSHDPCHGILKL